MKATVSTENRIKEWKSKYADRIVFSIPDNARLLKSLFENYDLLEIKLDLFGKNTVQTLRENSNYQDTDFREFQLINNAKSSVYYQEEETGDDIHIIIGNNTYLYSDNNHLYLDMFIQRGITRESFEQEDFFCQEYLSKFEQLDNLLAKK